MNRAIFIVQNRAEKSPFFRSDMNTQKRPVRHLTGQCLGVFISHQRKNRKL